MTTTGHDLSEYSPKTRVSMDFLGSRRIHMLATVFETHFSLPHPLDEGKSYPRKPVLVAGRIGDAASPIQMLRNEVKSELIFFLADIPTYKKGYLDHDIVSKIASTSGKPYLCHKDIVDVYQLLLDVLWLKSEELNSESFRMAYAAFRNAGRGKRS